MSDDSVTHKLNSEQRRMMKDLVEVLGSSFAATVSAPRPAIDGVGVSVAAAAKLLRNVPDELYSVRVAGLLAEAIMNSERSLKVLPFEVAYKNNELTQRMRTKFGRKGWAADAFKEHKAVERAIEESFKEAEELWVVRSRVKPDLDVGAQLRVRIGFDAMECTLTSVDATRGYYTFTSGGPNNTIVRHRVPFESMHSLPSVRTLHAHWKHLDDVRM